LFESIERLVEMEDFAWKSMVYKPFRLEDVYVEIALSLKEGVFAIDVEDVEVVGSSNGENDTHRFYSNDGGEGFVEIQASNLGVAFDNDSGFVLFEIAFGVVFDFENPL
jgi:hypothetical protein